MTRKDDPKVAKFPTRLALDIQNLFRHLRRPLSVGGSNRSKVENQPEMQPDHGEFPLIRNQNRVPRYPSPTRYFFSANFARSHTSSVQSSPPEIRREPSGVKLRVVTMPRCPANE